MGERDFDALMISFPPECLKSKIHQPFVQAGLAMFAGTVQLLIFTTCIKSIAASKSSSSRNMHLRQRPRFQCRIADIVKHRSLQNCAVVGSASSLIYLHKGEEIDSHAFVFRTNSHSTGKTVGNKTTHRIAANAFQLGPYRRQNHGVQQLVPTNSWSIHPGNLVTKMDNLTCIPRTIMSQIFYS